MHKTVPSVLLRPAFAGSLFLLSLVSAVRAEDAPSPVTGNVAVVSDYVFRGLTQSWGHPAIQGGADYTAANGFAAGTWASSISDKTYPGASMEWDLYANYGRSFATDWSWRAGVYGYFYPGGNLDEAGLPSRSFNTVEAQFALTWKQFTVKYNRALTDYFGVDTEQGYRDDSRGTEYYQIDASFPLDAAWTLGLHAGHTDYSTTLVTPTSGGARNPSYSDFGATLKYQFVAHWSLSLGVTHATNADFYDDTVSFQNAGDTRDVGGTRGFVMVQGTF